MSTDRSIFEKMPSVAIVVPSGGDDDAERIFHSSWFGIIRKQKPRIVASIQTDPRKKISFTDKTFSVLLRLNEREAPSDQTSSRDEPGNQDSSRHQRSLNPARYECENPHVTPYWSGALLKGDIINVSEQQKPFSSV